MSFGVSHCLEVYLKTLYSKKDNSKQEQHTHIDMFSRTDLACAKESNGDGGGGSGQDRLGSGDRHTPNFQ